MSTMPVVTVSPAPLRLVAGRQLSVAASTAATVDPQTMIARWLDSKSPTARRTYARALARFSAWAIGPEAAPHDGMQVLVQAGAGPAHSMVEGWRDELLASGLAPGSVAKQRGNYCPIDGHPREGGAS